MNSETKFYKLIKTFLGKDYHPPQIIAYNRQTWNSSTYLNQNKIVTYGLDDLIVDCYNVMDTFDLPMCRNAIIFLNNFQYYRENQNKLDVCKIYGTNPDLFDQFNSDTIQINFTNGSESEKNFVENLPDRGIFNKSDWKSHFKYGYLVAGISYQSGKYIGSCSKKRKTNRNIEIEKREKS